MYNLGKAGRLYRFGLCTLQNLEIVCTVQCISICGSGYIVHTVQCTGGEELEYCTAYSVQCTGWFTNSRSKLCKKSAENCEFCTMYINYSLSCT